MAPEPTAVDLAIRDGIAGTLEPYRGWFALEFIWGEGGGMWFTEVTPTSPNTAFLSVAFYGDTLYWAIGNASIEYFSIAEEDAAAFATEVTRCVAAGQVEETGFRRDATIRVRAASKIVISGGPVRLPWPWAWRRVRTYAPYAPLSSTNEQWS